MGDVPPARGPVTRLRPWRYFMKPAVDAIRPLCPDVDERLLRQHIEQLEPAYFERFSLEQVAEHLNALAAIPSRRASEVLLHEREPGLWDCTVLAMDCPFTFSLITGLLAAEGFSIVSGHVFTYARSSQPAKAQGKRRFQRPGQRVTTVVDPVHRRRIIDHFIGTVDPATADEAWPQRLRDRVEKVLGLVASNERHASERAKHLVNEMVTARLAHEQPADDAMLLPFELEIDESAEGRNRMVIRGQDTFAFLYTLSTALSLQGLEIEHVHIETRGQSVADEIHFVGPDGKMIRDPAVLARVRFTALLTKQFSYFLHRAPNPYQALTRFETLVREFQDMPDRSQWLESLGEPEAMRKLARLLGASDFLWEDFIRTQYESLAPLLDNAADTHSLCPPSETIEQRLEQALAPAVGVAEQADRLNRFKDRETYLIDLDQILNPATDFRKFSQRLTRLAEALVRKAAECVFNDMVRSYGCPKRKDGAEAAYAIFGLGKLGGEALGYASDIELMFIYDGPGETEGGRRGSIANTEFFEHMVRETAAFIRTKREGIFSVDLRLRPYGKDGPLAVSIEQFEHYYGPDGPAHAAERLALVRLRGIGGSEALARRAERARDRFVYEMQLVDVDAIWELRRRQYDQKVKRGRLDAKYHCGALVDLEYTVQLIQVKNAPLHPELRCSVMYQTLNRLKESGVIEPEQARQLIDAYGYYRHLINGLRMLRGSALDLVLPPEDSDELTHLARRTGYQRIGWMGPGRLLQVDFQIHSAGVRAFVECHYGRDRLPDPDCANPPDVILSDSLGPDIAAEALKPIEFDDPAAARDHLLEMRIDQRIRPVAARVAAHVCDTLRHEPGRNSALGRFVKLARQVADPATFYEALEGRPRLLEMLISILARLPEAAGYLQTQPESWRRLDDPDFLADLHPVDHHPQRVLDQLGITAPRQSGRSAAPESGR